MGNYGPTMILITVFLFLTATGVIGALEAV